MGMLLTISWIAAGALAVGLARMGAAETKAEWVTKIRKDHPRLFFNKDSWPQVKARALGPERQSYEELKKRADGYPDNPEGRSGGPAVGKEVKIGDRTHTVPKAESAREWGREAAETAFVYLMTGDRKYLDKARKMLQVSVEVYRKCYEERRAVNWYSTSRVCAFAAYDWLYNDLTAEERKELLAPLLQHVDDMQPGSGKPPIHRRNEGDHTTGFYGERNTLWFAGLAGYEDGVEDALALKHLKLGYRYNQDLFDYRKMCAGDDGGLASGTVAYAMGAYPWAQFNFIHTWRSATGENIAPQWPHLAYFPVWVMWNWIPAKERPKEYGFGDTYHYTNDLRPGSQLYEHMSQIMNFYGQSHPDCAALAAHIRTLVPDQRFASVWPMYPFLMTDIEKAPPPKAPGSQKPFARHFEALGQIFIRSGTGPEDTYCLCTIGSRVRSHKHHDENNFVIYRKGFLALDSGSRGNENDFNLRHYYAQTVAHNCILIHMPDEPLAEYWGERYNGPEGTTNHGGMNKTTGGKVAAFETNDLYTYVAGDATACYSERKCKLALRQFVFVMPDCFVICDRVISTRPEYRKEWLFHTQEEPDVEGNVFRADEGEGRLFCRTLLPKDAVLTKVGGRGKEFWACGKNWELNDAVWRENERIRKETGKPMLLGNWRIEVAPGLPRAEDVFLHLIQAGDRSLAAMAEAQPIEEEGKAGVRFKRGERSVSVVFGIAGRPSGHIKIAVADRVLTDTDLAKDVMPQEGLAEPPK